MSRSTEIVWTGKCRHCGVDWDLRHEELQASFPAQNFDVEEFIADCSCGQGVELGRIDVTTLPFSAWTVLPPASGCPECAVEHPPEMPHNRDSLHYQYFFRNREGRAGRPERWPTWHDAMAHCSPEMRKEWIATMATIGHVLNEDGSVTSSTT